jgi:hypothetical protein
VTNVSGKDFSDKIQKEFEENRAFAAKTNSPK